MAKNIQLWTLHDEKIPNINWQEQLLWIKKKFYFEESGQKKKWAVNSKLWPDMKHGMKLTNK